MAAIFCQKGQYLCSILNALFYRFEMTLPGMKKPLKPIPVFQQMPGEKKKQFFRRMDNTVKVCEGINMHNSDYRTEIKVCPQQ